MGAPAIRSGAACERALMTNDGVFELELAHAFVCACVYEQACACVLYHLCTYAGARA